MSERVSSIEPNNSRVVELLGPGVIERLIEEQRMLFFLERNDGTRRLWPEFVVGVPPEGIEPDDSAFIGGRLTVGQAVFNHPVEEEVIYKSPKGEIRGSAELISVTEEQAELLEARLEDVKAAVYQERYSPVFSKIFPQEK